MLEAARPRAQAGIDLVRGAGEALPFADRSFDFVTLITSLEFIPDPARAVREALRVARCRVAVAVLNRIGVRRVAIYVFVCAATPASSQILSAVLRPMP